MPRYHPDGRLLALIGLLLIAPVGAAQPPSAPASGGAIAPPAPTAGNTVFTLADAVALALRANPGLAAASEDVSAAHSGLDASRALVNPDITFAPALTPGGSEQEFLFRQPLEVNGTRAARTKVAAATLDQAQANMAVARQDLIARVEESYYRLWGAQQQERIAGELLTITQQLDSAAKEQVTAGVRPGVDRLQTRFAVDRASQEKAVAVGNTQAALARLNDLLNRAPDVDTGPLEAPALQSLPGANALQLAMARRPELVSGAAVEQRIKDQEQLLRADGRPDLAPQFRVGDVVRGIRDYGVGLSITLPLVDYGSRGNSIRQLQKSAAAQDDRLTSLRSAIRADVAAAEAKVRASDAVLQSFRGDVLLNSDQLLSAKRFGFAAGKTSIVDLFQAEQTYRAVQVDYINALVNAAIAHTTLLQAAGVIGAPGPWTASRMAPGEGPPTQVKSRLPTGKSTPPAARKE